MAKGATSVAGGRKRRLRLPRGPGRPRRQSRRRHMPSLAAGAQDASPICRRWRGCGWPPARPASATRTAPMCCWPCWRPERRSPASSPSPRRPPRRSNGAAAQLKRGTARALVVNSGNANAFTGKAGQEGVRDVAEIGGRDRRLPGAARFSWPRPASSASRCRPRTHHADSGLAGRGRRGRRLARRRRSDHDDRHLSEAGHGHAPDRRSSR